MFDTQVTVVGNLVADPRMTETKDGQPIASFRLASTPRRFDRATGEWKDGDTLFTSVTCWRALAENVHLSLRKGNSVIVIGRLSVRPYETKDGDKRQSVDIDAMAVGPELGRATTIIKRVERSVQSHVEAESGRSVGADFVTAEGPEGQDGEHDDDGHDEDAEVTGGGWGMPLSQPFSDTVSGGLVGGHVPQMDDDGTGPVLDPLAAVIGSAETDGLAEPVAQLASSGGRWRSRSAS